MKEVVYIKSARVGRALTIPFRQSKVQWRSSTNEQICTDSKISLSTLLSIQLIDRHLKSSQRQTINSFYVQPYTWTYFSDFNFSEKCSMFNFSIQTFTWKYVLVQQCFNRWVNFNEDCIFSLNKLILYLNPTLIRLFDIDSLIWERWRLLWCCVKMCVSVTHLMLELWSVAVGMCCSVELFNFAQLL